MIDNTVLLVPMLRHLHIELVHVVTSQFQLSRATKCVDGILNAVPDMNFRVLYHVTPDGDNITSNPRARMIREKLESKIVWRSKQALEDAIDRLKKKQQPPPRSFSINNNNSIGVDSTRGATLLGSRDMSRGHQGV